MVNLLSDDIMQMLTTKAGQKSEKNCGIDVLEKIAIDH